MKDLKNRIGKRLKQARLTAGISQRKLGVLAGIEEQSASARMNQYEKGVHLPNLLTLQHISKALGYPAAFFVLDDDWIAELFYLVHQLSEGDKLKLVDIVKDLALRHRETSNETTC